KRSFQEQLRKVIFPSAGSEKRSFSEPALSNSVSFLTALEKFVFLNRRLDTAFFLTNASLAQARHPRQLR
ncbi:MAG: hypothetical protein RR499_07095, partial [Mucinivorans sp.]